jgi:septal ring factor EnvC (AmiA/AmiB activator)
MKDMKNKFLEWFIALAVASVCIFFIVNYTMKGSNGAVAAELKENNEKIERVEYKLGEQQMQLNMINEQLFELDTNQNKYIQAIKENTRMQYLNYRQMQQIKSLYNEKINTANSYNYRQVDSFFSNRYDKYKKN